MTYYHAGPKNLTELRCARELIEDGVLTLEEYAATWETKWGDMVEDPWSLCNHPALDEICFTADLEEAEAIAQSIGGTVYVADLTAFEVVINNEGYPSVQESGVPVVAI